MLHRQSDEGLVVISQPSHAWISGQLASHWGNGRIGTDPAGTSLSLAAEQHDIAWLEWESMPTLNPDTGLPYAFNQMKTDEHIGLWRTATPRALSYGRLPAVLISMHGTYLYRRFHDFDADSSEEARLARAFLETEEAFQDSAIASIVDSGQMTREDIERQRRLVSLWDGISLGLCMGFDGERTFDSVPARNGDISLTFRRASGEPDEYAVDPWPFSGESVELICEGRSLDGRYDDEAVMRRALQQAAPVSLEFRLRPLNPE